MHESGEHHVRSTHHVMLSLVPHWRLDGVDEGSSSWQWLLAADNPSRGGPEGASRKEGET